MRSDQDRPASQTERAREADTDGTKFASRRRVLGSIALLGSVTLAGCTDSEVTTVRVRDLETYDLVIPADALDTEFRADQVDLIRETTANGNVTVNGYDPFDSGAYVRLNDTYYRIWTEQGTEATAE